MEWQLWVLIGIIIISVVGTGVIDMRKNREWVNRVEQTCRDFEVLKLKHVEQQQWIEKHLVNLNKDIQQLKESYEEVNKFARGLETELYETYDILEAMGREKE